VRLVDAVLALLGFAMLLKQDTPAAVFPFNQKYVATFLNDEPFVGIVRYRQIERKGLPPSGSILWVAAGTMDATVSVFRVLLRRRMFFPCSKPSNLDGLSCEDHGRCGEVPDGLASGPALAHGG
jgi:hypothetical protein